MLAPLPSNALFVAATTSFVALVLSLFGPLRTGVGQEETGSIHASVSETDDVIAVRSGERAILEYRKTAPDLPAGIEPVFQRSGFLHPVQTPAGFAVTAAYPVDHPHQQGIFNAWVSTEYDGHEIDFWNLAKQLGRVRHERVITIEPDPERPSFEVSMLHEVLVPQPQAVLREVWKVRLIKATAAYHCFDIELQQQALTDKPLLIRKYHYGGMAVRGPVEWLLGNESRRAASGNAEEPAVILTNNLGSNRQAGNHQPVKWVRLSGPNGRGSSASIIAMSRASNMRAPQTARLHPSKPYFCFTPCVEEEFIVDKQHAYVGQYRFYVVDDEPSDSWLLAEFDAWHQE